MNVAAALTLEWTIGLAPRAERVFAAITEARHLEHWFCDAARCEPGVGGAILLRWSRAGSSAEPFEGAWTAWSPPVLAAYAGGHDGYPDRHAGTVTFALEDADGAPRLTVRHAFPPRAEYEPIADRYRDAWPRALARLTAYLTPEEPTP